MNKLLCAGNVTKDPKRNEGGSLVYFTIAITREYKNKITNEYESDFLNFMAFAKAAEYLEKYIKKGDVVSVTARVQNGKKIDDSYPNDIYIIERINRLKKGKAHQESELDVNSDSGSFFN